MILLTSKGISRKSTKRELAPNYGTDDATKEDKHDYNDSDSNEESKRDEEKDDDSDDAWKLET